MMRICIPIRELSPQGGKLLKNSLKKVAVACKFGDLVEVWLDGLPQPVKESDLKALVKVAKTSKVGRKPLIAVCKAPFEKGSFKGVHRLSGVPLLREVARIGVLKKAIAAGFQYADVGIHTAPKLVRDLKKVCYQNRAKLIISWHNWEAHMPTLSKMKQVALKAKRMGADIIKIAVNVKNWSDNILLFELTKWAASKNRLQIIVIGMGDRGKISRIGCPLLGAYLTYFALDKKSKTAKGQWTLAEVARLDKLLDRIDTSKLPSARDQLKNI